MEPTDLGPSAYTAFYSWIPMQLAWIFGMLQSPQLSMRLELFEKTEPQGTIWKMEPLEFGTIGKKDPFEKKEPLKQTEPYKKRNHWSIENV